MYEEGYIKLWRKMMTWRWYKNNNTKALFLHLLFNANLWEAEFEGIKIQRGQLVTSCKNLSSNTGMTQQNIKTAIKNLKSTNEITSKATNKFTVITLVNFEDYQGESKRSTNKLTSNLNNNQQTTNQRLTFNQPQYKNIKNTKNNKNESVPPVFLSLGVYENVKLTAEDYEKWKAERPNDYKEKIERLSAVMKAKGTKYADHLATLRLWALEDDDNKKETVKESPKYRKLE